VQKLPDGEVSAMFAGKAALPRLTPHFITSRAKLLAELRKIREAGCAVNVEESEEGVASVAIAVRCGCPRWRWWCQGPCPG
jgi:DNA-binding IclR family transcriptional regulator